MTSDLGVGSLWCEIVGAHQKKHHERRFCFGVCACVLCLQSQIRPIKSMWNSNRWHETSQRPISKKEHCLPTSNFVAKRSWVMGWAPSINSCKRQIVLSHKQYHKPQYLDLIQTGWSQTMWWMWGFDSIFTISPMGGVTCKEQLWTSTTWAMIKTLVI